MTKTKELTRSAMLLALALVFQSLRLIPAVGAWPYSAYLIGSLVNLVLIVAAGAVGRNAIALVSVFTPVVAFFQGFLPFPVLIPVVAVGNALLAFTFYHFQKRYKGFGKYLGVVIGAAFKWAILFSGATYLLKALTPGIDPKKLAAISTAFNFQQIITALIGGFSAIALLSALPKNSDK